MPKQIEIWTMAYLPFTMGGKVHRPVKATVDAEGPFDIGGGYSAYLVIAPAGKTFVAEAETGALIGPTIEAVREDITDALASDGGSKIMADQIAEARKQIADAEPWDADQLWHALRAA